MSDTGDILDRFLVDVAAGITGTVRTHRGEKAWDQIPAATTPFAMTYGWAWAADQDEEGHRVETQTVIFICEIYGTQRTKAELETWLDEIQTELATDRDLNGLVDWVWISDALPTSPNEHDDENKADRALVLSVAAERTV